MVRSATEQIASIRSRHAVAQPERRWLATIIYNTSAGHLHDRHDIDELDEIAAIVEMSPDWNAIDKIMIPLNPDLRMYPAGSTHRGTI